MNDKEILEMANVVCAHCIAETNEPCERNKKECECYFYGKLFYDAGYRKVPKNGAVLTEEENTRFIDFVKQQKDCARKETAKAIITSIRNIKHVGSLRSELDLLASKYGVEDERTDN